MLALLVVEIDPVTNDPAGMLQGLETVATTLASFECDGVIAANALALAPRRIGVTVAEACVVTVCLGRSGTVC